VRHALAASGNASGASTMVSIAAIWRCRPFLLEGNRLFVLLELGDPLFQFAARMVDALDAVQPAARCGGARALASRRRHHGLGQASTPVVFAIT
jgi:hypothetical protein